MYRSETERMRKQQQQQQMMMIFLRTKEKKVLPSRWVPLHERFVIQGVLQALEDPTGLDTLCSYCSSQSLTPQIIMQPRDKSSKVIRVDCSIDYLDARVACLDCPASYRPARPCIDPENGSKEGPWRGSLAYR